MRYADSTHTLWSFCTQFALVGLSVLVVLVSAPSAHAGLLIKPPLYIGLNSGLVGFWSFNQADIAGVTAYDRSGQGNNGTLTNGPTRVGGKIGQGLSFDGRNDYVDLNADPVGTNTVTVCAWIYFNPFTDATYKSIVGNGYFGFSVFRNDTYQLRSSSVIGGVPEVI